MKQVHIRNNPNWVFNLIIIAAGLFTYGIHTILNHRWLNLLWLILILIIICLILYFRNVLIKISEKNVSRASKEAQPMTLEDLITVSQYLNKQK